MKCHALLGLLLLTGHPALAGGNGAPPSFVGLPNLLPPPLAAGSAAAQRDLQAVLAVQHSRSTEDMAAAKADAEHSVFRFADAIGLTMPASSLPKTATFFERVARFDKGEVKQAKAYWQRPRPSMVSTEVHPLSKEKSDGWSYPSGHATFGYTTAVLLANMLPEKRAQIFTRADLYAQHRVVMGAHFPSDVEAGKLAGTVLADEVLHDAQWQADYNMARSELRKALELP